MSFPWLIALLMGIAPIDFHQPQPVVPHLKQDRSRQVRLNSSPKAQNLKSRWGRWSVRWDQRAGIPRALIGGGVVRGDVPQFVADIAHLSGVAPASLIQEGGGVRKNREVVRYQQYWMGAPVVEGYVDVHLQHGAVHYVLVSLHHPRANIIPLPNEVWLALPDEEKPIYRPVTVMEDGDMVTYWGRDGELVHSYSKRLYLELETEERTIGDPLVTVPARQMLVSNEESSQYTDDAGAHTLEQPVDVSGNGVYLRLSDQSELVVVPDVEDEFLKWDEDLSPAASSVQHHFYVVRDWLELRRPDHPWLGSKVRASVRVEGSCNAYYTGGTLNFYSEGGGCEDFGRVADIIYHEYGHGVHDYIIESGSFASDVSEGSADYISSTIVNDPVLAPESYGAGSYIREIETDKIYPDDISGEVHNDGLIWASFMWNLRQQWEAAYGQELGWELADKLFLQTLSYGPGLTDLYEAVLAADDDDGDVSNGTPHACELIELLNYHGLGPGMVGIVDFDHHAIPSAASYELSYEVEFGIADMLSDCPSLGIDLNTPRVWYAVEQPHDRPVEEIIFMEANTTLVDGRYHASIPRQAAGYEVAYAVAWDSIDGGQTVVSHGGTADGLYRFIVGDREELWCEDFEGEAPLILRLDGYAGWEDWVYGPGYPIEYPDQQWESEWAVSIPSGGEYTPDLAAGGDFVLGTRLTGNGAYLANNTQFARTPFVDISDANEYLFLLTSDRWLSVEDASFDRAEVYQLDANVLGRGELLWRNRESAAGDDHTIDNGWVQFDIDLQDLALQSEEVAFAYVLASDNDFELGGWALDNVCLVTLNDVPGHFRVRDLEYAQEDEGYRLMWTEPFIELGQTVLVRNSEHMPQSFEDGEVVVLKEEADWGRKRVVLDDSASDGDLFYAVFAADVAGNWFNEVVEGDNGVAITEAGGGRVESYQVQNQVTESACGCATGHLRHMPGFLVWFVLLGSLVSVRRQYSHQ